jgi:hypothetical protein
VNPDPGPVVFALGQGHRRLYYYCGSTVQYCIRKINDPILKQRFKHSLFTTTVAKYILVCLEFKLTAFTAAATTGSASAVGHRQPACQCCQCHCTRAVVTGTGTEALQCSASGTTTMAHLRHCKMLELRQVSAASSMTSRMGAELEWSPVSAAL